METCGRFSSCVQQGLTKIVNGAAFVWSWSGAEKTGKSLRDHNLRLFELNEYLLESNRMILNTLKSKFNTTEDKLSVEDLKYSNELIETLADANHKHVLIRSDEDEGYSPEPTLSSVKNNFKTKS